MPIDPVTGAIIDNVAQIAGNVINNNANKNRASEQADWNRENQLNQMRFDMHMWNKTNKYNTPAAQMERYKEAGLNPHLIYGKAQSGNAQPLRSPDVKNYSRAETKSVTQGITAFGDYARLKNIEAQTSNVEAQTKVSEQTELLTAQKILGEALNLDKGKLDLGIATERRKTSVDAAKVNLERLQAESTNATNKAYVSTQTQETQIKTAEQNFKNQVLKGKGIKFENLIKQYQSELNEMGIQKTDPIILRWINQLINQATPSQIKQLKGIL